jgi:hypothetical protein
VFVSDTCSALSPEPRASEVPHARSPESRFDFLPCHQHSCNCGNPHTHSSQCYHLSADRGWARHVPCLWLSRPPTLDLMGHAPTESLQEQSGGMFEPEAVLVPCSVLSGQISCMRTTKWLGSWRPVSLHALQGSCDKGL